MREALLYAPVLQSFKIIAYMTNKEGIEEAIEFEVSIVELCRKYNDFWDDYSRAGGFTGDDLRAIDSFAPTYLIYEEDDE